MNIRKKPTSRQRVIIVTYNQQLVIHIYTHTHTYIQTLTVLRQRTVTSAHSATTSCAQGVLECVHVHTLPNMQCIMMFLKKLKKEK